MPEAAIVSAARTPIGRAFRGAYNQTHGATLAGHAIRHAVERAGVDPAEVEDVILGVGLPEGATGNNLGRVAALRAGLPLRVPGTTINRYCGSGLKSIATAAGRIVADGAKVVVAGGCESISLVQNVMNVHNFTEEWTLRHEPDLYMPMLQTADAVAKHYKVTREAQDAYALQSQQRTAAAQAAGKFDDEIVPLATWKSVEHKESGTFTEEQVMRIGDAEVEERPVIEFARHDEGGHASQIGTVSQNLQIEHEPHQLLEVVGRSGRGIGKIFARAVALLGQLKAAFDFANVIEVIVQS